MFLSPGEKCTSSEFLSLKFYPLRTAWKCKGNSREEKILFSSFLLWPILPLLDYSLWFYFCKSHPTLPSPSLFHIPRHSDVCKMNNKNSNFSEQSEQQSCLEGPLLITKDLAILLKDNFYQLQSLCSDNGLNIRNVKRPFPVWQARAGTWCLQWVSHHF